MIRRENIYYILSPTILDRVKELLREYKKLEEEVKVSKWLDGEIIMMRVHLTLLEKLGSWRIKMKNIKR